MKRKFMLMIVAMLVVSLLAGCAGTIVVVNECTCPAAEGNVPSATDSTAPDVTLGDGAVKTGLAVFTKISGSTSAAEGEEGTVEYDITMAAVTVDDNGVITSCKIDSVAASVKIDGKGNITSDPTAPILTKNELGADYGMVAWGKAIAEWDQQVAAFCDYVVGKTADEVTGIAVSEGKPADADLAASVTIKIGDFQTLIAAAVNNAKHMGAQSGDEMALVTVNSLGDSASAAAGKNGNAQLNTNIAVVTSRDGVITSCIIDAVQAKVSFDTTGKITTDLSVPVQTKNELGEAYGMKSYGGAIAEWNEQAAAFAAYVTGKTADEVAGIAVDEKTAPTDADLASSVTIKIGDFQTLIAKVLD